MNIFHHNDQDNKTLVSLTRSAFIYLLRLLIVVTGMLSSVQASVLIASASSIREPLDKIVQLYRQQHQIDINVSYGASGNLTHQILRGAPYEVLLSANSEFPSRIEAAGYHLEPALDYAIGRLVLYANSQSDCNIENGVSGLPVQLARGSIKRIAIANPDLAPYGIAARQALENTNAWPELQKHLALGNSVAQAAHFALSGAADCAVISMSLALHAGLNSQGRFRLIDDSQYSPIRHQMILLKAAGEEAKEFLSIFAITRSGLNIFTIWI